MIKNIIIDCDTGQDDAIAIILAIASKQLNVVGISTVGGNARVEQCTNNTLKILKLMNQNIPVYAGEKNPLKKKLNTLPEVFGESGMAGGDDLPLSEFMVSDIKAVDFLTKTFSVENNISICAIAPMTNIAKALLNKKTKINQITTMCGCPFPEPIKNLMGNMDNGKAEYNAWSDPDAFKIVLDNVKNINLIGLNITRSVLYNYEYDNILKEINTKLSKAVAKILSTIGDEDKIDYKSCKKFQNDPVRAMHDVVAAAYIIDPTIFKTKILPIRVGDNGETIIDKNGRQINIITDIDKRKFFDLFISTIKNYEK